MKITYSNRNHLHIEGENKSVYMVDLDANGRKGSCNCKQFKIRVQPAWNEGRKVAPCKHILFGFGVVCYRKMHGI